MSEFSDQDIRWKEATTSKQTRMSVHEMSNNQLSPSYDTLSLDCLDIFDEIQDELRSSFGGQAKDGQASIFDPDFDFDESFLDDVQLDQSDSSACHREPQVSGRVQEVTVGSSLGPSIHSEAVSPSNYSYNEPYSVLSSGNKSIMSVINLHH